ncbi:hypothetical protein BpHYR1_052061 [Brachionus plicatilis]|uniref:Uncharacterized protein n=1 Tax=Brachionus plicatilis TaxID=10195 RepID=A0A3M7Q1Z8_BRAPC|nr:hypothetical protein BpHYR1_052061 [Brachionus plicatilis]
MINMLSDWPFINKLFLFIYIYVITANQQILTGSLGDSQSVWSIYGGGQIESTNSVDKVQTRLRVHVFNDCQKNNILITNTYFYNFSFTAFSIRNYFSMCYVQGATIGDLLVGHIRKLVLLNISSKIEKGMKVRKQDNLDQNS